MSKSYEEFYVRIANRVRGRVIMLRRSLEPRMSQVKIAALSNMSNSSVSGIESGHNVVSLYTLTKLIRTFNNLISNDRSRITYDDFLIISDDEFYHRFIKGKQ